MSRGANAGEVAVGFRVRSGCATAVLLAGPIETPQAIDHRVVDLSDAAVPESKQPYHAAAGMLEEDRDKIRDRTQVVRRVATRSVNDLLQRYSAAGHQVRGAGLVVGSRIDPTSIQNPHIRAHALEGQLFRTVLEEALKTHGVACSVVLERDAYAEAAAVLACSEHDLKHAVSRLGRSLQGPWRAEEKLAAAAAWMALADNRRSESVPRIT